MIRCVRAVFAILMFVAVLCAYHALNIYLAPRAIPVASTPLDRLIPVLSCFVWPYLAFYVVVLCAFVRATARDCFWGVFGISMAVVAGSFVAFSLWPTSLQRPGVHGMGISDRVLTGLWSLDGPANCVPSLHVSLSIWAVYIAYRVGTVRRLGAVLVALILGVAPLFVRQHLLLDVLGGAGVGVLAVIGGRRLMWGARDGMVTGARRAAGEFIGVLRAVAWIIPFSVGYTFLVDAWSVSRMDPIRAVRASLFGRDRGCHLAGAEAEDQFRIKPEWAVAGSPAGIEDLLRAMAELEVASSVEQAANGMRKLSTAVRRLGIMSTYHDSPLALRDAVQPILSWLSSHEMRIWLLGSWLAGQEPTTLAAALLNREDALRQVRSREAWLAFWNCQASEDCLGWIGQHPVPKEIQELLQLQRQCIFVRVALEIAAYRRENGRWPRVLSDAISASEDFALMRDPVSLEPYLYNGGSLEMHLFSSPVGDVLPGLRWPR